MIGSHSVFPDGAIWVVFQLLGEFGFQLTETKQAQESDDVFAQLSMTWNLKDHLDNRRQVKIAIITPGLKTAGIAEGYAGQLTCGGTDSSTGSFAQQLPALTRLQARRLRRQPHAVPRSSTFRRIGDCQLQSDWLT